MPVKSLGNVVINYNSVNITPYLNQGSLQTLAEMADTTNFASTAKEQIPTLPGYKVPIGGLWAAAVDAAIGADCRTPPATLRTLVITIGPVSNRVTHTWTGSATVGAFPDSWDVDFGDPAAATTWSANLSISGAPVIS